MLPTDADARDDIARQSSQGSTQPPQLIARESGGRDAEFARARIRAEQGEQTRARKRERGRAAYREGKDSRRSVPVAECIYKFATHFKVVWRAPDPETGFSKLLWSEPFPLDTPLEMLEQFRDARKREAARAWAPVLEERKRQAQKRREEKRRHDRETRRQRDARTLVARNIYKERNGWRVFWSAPNPKTKRYKPHSARFGGRRTLKWLEAFRDARELEAKRAWARIREEREREVLARRRARHEPQTSITLAKNIYKFFRKSDKAPLFFRVAVPDGNGGRRSRQFPLITTIEELVRHRDDMTIGPAPRRAPTPFSVQLKRELTEARLSLGAAAIFFDISETQIKRHLKGLIPTVRLVKIYEQRLSKRRGRPVSFEL